MTDTEKTVEVEEKSEVSESFDKLSNREALERAISDVQEEKPAPVPTKKEVKQEVSTEIEPPAGFSKEGVKAWKEKDITGIQKEYRRIHDSRTQEISRAQAAERKAMAEAEKERNEAKTWRDLGSKMAPYIEARGQQGVSPEKAMMEALDLVHAFKKADPATAKAELKKIGIDLDATNGKPSTVVPPELEEKINTLQKGIETLTSEKEREKLEQVGRLFQKTFDHLASLKNRAGELVFPDLLDESDDGKELARAIGSRTRDEGFQKRVLRRFPDADFTVLVREAYRAEGGRVSGEPVQVSQENQKKHIEKSKRAAAATPGKTVSREGSQNLVGKLSRRAALERALAEQQEH